MREAISEAKSGDRLRLVRESGTSFLGDAAGRRIIRMANAWKKPPNEELRVAKVRGIYERRRDDGKAAERYAQPNCERWEVVLPDFLWRRADARPDSG